MRLCKVTETGLEFVQTKDVSPKIPIEFAYDSMIELETAMRKHPESFEENVDYTLHEDKPVLRIVSETKTRVERNNG